MMAALMIASKKLMELLPNIHLVGTFVILLTILFRAKALIPIYVYVFLDGLLGGFSMWWYPYLYIWAVLWALAMLIPRNIPRRLAAVLYPTMCALHGFTFGIVYAPAQALMFGMDAEQMLAWIISGIPFDIIHGVSNIFTGMLVLPLVELVQRMMKRYEA